MSMETRNDIHEEGPSRLGIPIWALNARGEELQWSVIDDAHVFDALDLVHVYNVENNGRRIIDDGYVFDSFDLVHDDSMENNGGVLGVTPATKHSIENLEKITIDGTKESSSMPMCSICLGVLSTGSKAIRMPEPCSHVYHQHCIVKWLNKSNTCPLCRRSI